MRSTASSGSPYEVSIGFSRAVRIGNRILVSGTAPVEDDGSSTQGDAEAQAERCLAVIVRAVEQIAVEATRYATPSAQGTLTEMLAWQLGLPAPRGYVRNDTAVLARLFAERVLPESGK